MAAAVERLARQALALSDQERAQLARKLLLSLEGRANEGVSAAWDIEIEKRVERIREGTAKADRLNKCLGIFELVTSEASRNRGRGGT
jgi:Putative addiction module component